MAERVSHVRRFYGPDGSGDSTDPGGPDNSDAWIDVEILDSLTIERGTGPAYQKTVYTFDYPENPDPASNPDSDTDGRRFQYLRVKNPDDDTQYVDIPITVSVVIENQAQGGNYQKRVIRFDNSSTTALDIDSNPITIANSDTRVTHTKNVFYNDISDEFLDEDGNPPSDPQDYLDAITATDDQSDTNNFLEVEVIDKFTIETGTGPSYQKTIYALAWQDDILMQEPLVPTDGGSI